MIRYTDKINHSQINNILCSLKLFNKKTCYKECMDMLNNTIKNEFVKSVMDLTFDDLYERQINEMTDEFDHYFININHSRIEEIELMQKSLINNYNIEVSIIGILKYVVNIVCRNQLINYLHNGANYVS